MERESRLILTRYAFATFEAQGLARRIQDRGNEQSTNCKLAAQVLAFDPNAPNMPGQVP